MKKMNEWAENICTSALEHYEILNIAFFYPKFIIPALELCENDYFDCQLRISYVIKP